MRIHALGFWLALPMAAACSDSVSPSANDAGTADRAVVDSSVDSSARDANQPVVDAATRDAASDASADAPVDSDFDAGSDAATDAATDGGGDAGAPPIAEVHFVGRTDISNAADVVSAWPATGVVIRFNGPSAEATLSTDLGNSAGPAYLDVIVDGAKKVPALAVPKATATVTLASGLGAGSHTIELVKRTEADDGFVHYKGFAFPGGGQLLAPPVRSGRRIEMIGNSSISGYGMDGPGPNCPGGAPSNAANATSSVGALTARTLNAELSLLAFGGKGVLINITANDAETLPVLFDRTLPYSAAPAWDFARFQPDAVIVTLANLDIDASDAARANAYEAFAQKIRVKYTNARIVLVVTAYSSDDYPANAQTRTRFIATAKEVVRRRGLAGDANVSQHTMTAYLDSQLTGCDYHPNAQLHAQMSAELTQWLRAELGW